MAQGMRVLSLNLNLFSSVPVSLSLIHTWIYSACRIQVHTDFKTGPHQHCLGHKVTQRKKEKTYLCRLNQNEKHTHLCLYKACRLNFAETLLCNILISTKHYFSSSLMTWQDDISVVLDVRMNVCVDRKGHCTWRSCQWFSPTDHKRTRQGQRDLGKRGEKEQRREEREEKNEKSLSKVKKITACKQIVKLCGIKTDREA